MADPNVVSYIKQQLAAGAPQESIASALGSAGWDAARINEAFAEVRGEPAAQPAHPAKPAQPARDSQAEAFAGAETPAGRHELPDFDRAAIRDVRSVTRPADQLQRQPKSHRGLIIALSFLVLLETLIIAGGMAFYLLGPDRSLSLLGLSVPAAAIEPASQDSSAPLPPDSGTLGTVTATSTGMPPASEDGSSTAATTSTPQPAAASVATGTPQ